MARPKKKNQLTHTHHVTLRITDVQYENISEASKQAGLSLSEYIRTQIMKGKVVAKYEIVTDMPELKKLISEFGRIGNNLDQMPSLRWGRPLPAALTKAEPIHWKCRKQPASASLKFTG